MKGRILLKSELKQILEEGLELATEVRYDCYGFPLPPIEDRALYVLKHLMEHLEEEE